MFADLEQPECSGGFQNLLLMNTLLYIDNAKPATLCGKILL